MCTIGYHKKLNLLFKNRDKNTAENEVNIVKPDFLAVKSEGADYYSVGSNKYGCSFVSAAVNTPKWTSLSLAGKTEDALIQFREENQGLLNPMIVVSRHLPDVHNVNEWLEIILNSKDSFMGYNVLLVDREKAVHVELYRKGSHLSWLDKDTVITNHFQRISHGPRVKKDYLSSFRRLDFAANQIGRAVSIEDLFQILKTQDTQARAGLWRKGVFSTISSSVLDSEARTLYYSSGRRQNYARIAANIPAKGNEKVFLEMSRYIDLPTYHNIERGHPFYVEMMEEIQIQIREHYNEIAGQSSKEMKLRTLELGAGTGLCSLELIKHPFLQLDVLDIDSKCCEILNSHHQSAQYKVILGDASTYCRPRHYHLVVSTFAHDHVHYNNRVSFAANIYNNLRKDGYYIMGGEIIPYFSNESERKMALFKYHNYSIEQALRHNRVQLSEIENNALKSGLDMVGDFKRHEAMFEKEMESAGLDLVVKKKIGPLDRDDVGGVFVYMYKAV